MSFSRRVHWGGTPLSDAVAGPAPLSAGGPHLAKKGLLTRSIRPTVTASLTRKPRKVTGLAVTVKSEPVWLCGVSGSVGSQ